MKIVECLMYFFGTLFILDLYCMWLIFPYFGEIPTKISAMLFIILGIIVFVLAIILAKREKEENKK